MLNKPKLDKISFTIDRRKVLPNKLKDVISFFESRQDVTYNNSKCYIVVHITPTKLTRPNLNYNNHQVSHNLQMNTDLLIEFFKQLEAFSIPLDSLNITNLHIAKDRIMDNPPLIYNKFLLEKQTRYKGKIRAFEVNNGTSPSLHICNYSKSLNRGTWLIKCYNKGEQLKDILKLTEVVPLEPLSKDDIKILGRGYSKYTGRINLDKVNLLRFEIELKTEKLLLLPHRGKRLKISDILEMLEQGTLYDRLNEVFKTIMTSALLFTKTKTSKAFELDKFLVCGNMSRFDSLFKAMGIYANYKDYTKNVMPEEELLLNEIYERFVKYQCFENPLATLDRSSFVK